MNTVFEQQKQSTGGLAAIVFLVSGLYLCFFSAGGGLGFLLKTGLFLVLGMFLAALIIGMPAYLAQRLLSKLFLKLSHRGFIDLFSTRARRALKTLGFAIFVLEIFVTYKAAKLAHSWLFLS
jgi:hypothetical protein